MMLAIQDMAPSAARTASNPVSTCETTLLQKLEPPNQGTLDYETSCQGRGSKALSFCNCNLVCLLFSHGRLLPPIEIKQYSIPFK